MPARMGLGEKVLEQDENLALGRISAQFAEMNGKAEQAQAISSYLFPQVSLGWAEWEGFCFAAELSGQEVCAWPRSSLQEDACVALNMFS